MFSKLGVVKFLASGVVGIGTSKIVGQIIKNNMPPTDTLLDKVTVTAAAWVIGVMVSTGTKEYTDKLIDETVTAVSDVVKKGRVRGKINLINSGKMTWEDSGLDREDFVMSSDGTFRSREDDK